MIITILFEFFKVVDGEEFGVESFIKRFIVMFLFNCRNKVIEGRIVSDLYTD